MNEQGLVANLLFLVESEYPGDKGDARPQMSIAAWTQYMLDSFATVEEAVAEMRKEAFRPVAVVAPNGVEGKIHLSISDASGDSAIFEYLDGKLVIHHGRQYQVMTNSPSYDQQLALNEYWKQIGGTVMLPGTHRAADRFARASFYINATQQSADPREAVAAVFSVPRGISTPGQPNLSSTIWRTVADQKNKVYFFEDTFSPSLVWVKLNQIDFKAGSGVRKLTLHGNPNDHVVVASPRTMKVCTFMATSAATKPPTSKKPSHSCSWRPIEPGGEEPFSRSLDDSLQRTALYRPPLNSTV